MLIQLDLQADGQFVRLSVPQAQLSLHVPDIVASVPERKIVAIGLTGDQLREAAPEKWGKLERTIRFEHSFDITDFSPYLAAAVLSYYAAAAYAKIRRYPLFPSPFDRFEYTLQIDGYDTLPSQVHYAFEYAICCSRSTRTNGLTVNGQDKAKTLRQIRVTAATLKWLVVGWLIPLFTAVVLIARLLPGNPLQQPLTGLGIPIGIAVVLGVGTGLGYVACFLGALTSLLILRPIFPKRLLKVVLTNTKLGLPRPAIVWLAKDVLREPIGASD